MSADAEDIAVIVELIRSSSAPLEYAASMNLQRHLNEIQRAMIGARLADIPVGRHADGNSATIADAAKALGVSRSSVVEAKRILRRGTAEEIKMADAGHLPLAAGRQMRRGLQSEGRPTLPLPLMRGPGRISRLGETVYQRLAEEGPATQSWRRRKSAATPEPAPSPPPSPPEPSPPPLTLVEVVRALITFSVEYQFEEVVGVVGGEFQAEELDHLITWLLEIYERALKASSQIKASASG